MRALFRTTVCVAVLTPFALLIAGSASAVTIATVGSYFGTGATTINNQAVATAEDYPYCSGTYEAIQGSGFVYDSANPDPTKGAVISVMMGNVPAAQFWVGSDTKMYAQVGKGATTGPVVVTTTAGTFSTDSLPGGRLDGGLGTALQNLTPGLKIIPCVSKPTIVKAAVTSIKPSKAKGGKRVTINGSGFSGVTKVTIGGKDATFAVVQDQNMVVIVPTTAKNGKLPVVITNSAGTVTSTVSLTKTG